MVGAVRPSLYTMGAGAWLYYFQRNSTCLLDLSGARSQLIDPSHAEARSTA